MDISYLIIGAGATGGCIGGYLAAAGKQVSFLARGRHLKALEENGLNIYKADDSVLSLPSVKVFSQDQWPADHFPDVIFICVKGYSLSEMVPFLARCCHKNTVIIPILNIYGTGEKLAGLLPGIQVLDGCIYIASEIVSPGIIKQKGDIFRVVFGRRDGRIDLPFLKQIEKDLSDSGILPVLSSQVKVDTYRKYTYVSAQNAVGLFYDADAGKIMQTPEIRQAFLDCIQELRKLGLAMGIVLEENIAHINLKILSELDPSMTTSMQKDLAAGKDSEIDGLIFEVVRLGQKYGVAVPLYETIAADLKKRYPGRPKNMVR